MFHDQPKTNEYGNLVLPAEAQLRLECLRIAARTTGVGGDGRESANSSVMRLQLMADDLYQYILKGRCDGARR